MRERESECVYVCEHSGHVVSLRLQEEGSASKRRVFLSGGRLGGGAGGIAVLPGTDHLMLENTVSDHGCPMLAKANTRITLASGDATSKQQMRPASSCDWSTTC